MAILLQVKWVDQSDRSEAHQRIQQIGGDSGELQWHHTQAQAIESIEQDQFAYYVEKDARVLKLGVGQTAHGEKYLTVRPDGGPPEILLQLPGRPNPDPAQSASN
jgi:Protein of unknown function (DUF3892)